MIEMRWVLSPQGAVQTLLGRATLQYREQVEGGDGYWGWSEWQTIPYFPLASSAAASATASRATDGFGESLTR